MLESASATPLWLAVGVIVSPGVKVVPAERGASHKRGLRFLHQSFVSRLNGTIAWQWVTTEAQRHADPRFTVVKCRDGPFTNADGARMRGDELTTAVASACACKTILWFRRALRLFPGARFLAKAEDDSALHDARPARTAEVRDRESNPHTRLPTSG